MGGAGGKNAAPPLSLSDVFADACPDYLRMGMTYEQFWDGDVSAHKAFRRAEKLRLSEANRMAWLHGMYIYEALCDVTPYLKAFSKARPRPYRKEPYDLFEDERRRREEREAKERYERVQRNVMAFAKAFNEKQQQKSEIKGGDDNAGCVP